MDYTHRARNDAARTRLVALVGRLTPRILDQPLGGSWTIKAALAHLAFWDRFALATLQQWQQDGFTPSGDDSAYINLAGLNDWLAVPADYALREVVRAAELVDGVASTISEMLRAEIAAGGESWSYERGVHRVEHIEQVERALANARATLCQGA